MNYVQLSHPKLHNVVVYTSKNFYNRFKLGMKNNFSIKKMLADDRVRTGSRSNEQSLLIRKQAQSFANFCKASSNSVDHCIFHFLWNEVQDNNKLHECISAVLMTDIPKKTVHKQLSRVYVRYQAINCVWNAPTRNAYPN